MINSQRIRLIIAREYKALVFTKAFIIMSLLMPIIMLAFLFLPPLLMDAGSSSLEHVAVIDETGRYFAALEPNDEFDFEDISPIGKECAREFFNATQHTYAVVIIPADIDSSLCASIYSNSTVRTALCTHVEKCLQEAVSNSRIDSYNIPQLRQVIADCHVNLDINSVQWVDNGREEASSAELAMAIGLVLAFLSYAFVIIYGAMVMNSVLEEKTNRIVEVIVSSCRPVELMLGKIIGVGLAGVSQIALWTVIGAILLLIAGISIVPAALATGAIDSGALTSAANAASLNNGFASLIALALNINYAEIVICFLLYFIGGYLLYAAMFAALGSAVDQQSEASQFMSPMIVLMVVALMIGLACIENPNGNLAFWCSMIPFTSPIVMMIRIPYDVPLWQYVVSIAILFATAIAVTALAGKIYRQGILTCGRKTSFLTLLHRLH